MMVYLMQSQEVAEVATAHSNDIKIYVSLMHQGVYLLPMFADSYMLFSIL